MSFGPWIKHTITRTEPIRRERLTNNYKVNRKFWVKFTVEEKLWKCLKGYVLINEREDPKESNK